MKLLLTALAVFFSSASFAQEGASLYSAFCSGCHGRGGEGGRAPALRKAGLLLTVEQGYFAKSIRAGRQFRGCPSFRDKITPEGIESVAAFIKSWQTGKLLAAPGHGVEARNTENGKSLFALCGGCHGTEGEGAMGPPLLDPGFLESISDTELRRTIMWGRPGTPMKGYLKGMGGLAELAPSEIDEIISYMRYRQKAPGGTDAERIKAP